MTATQASFWPTTLSDWIDSVAKIGAIFVVGFGVFEYIDRKEAARIEATQDLMQEYSKGEVLAARQLILQTTLPHLPVVRRLQEAGAPSEAHKDLVTFLVNETRGGTGLGAEIDIMLEFAERVVVCVEQEICNESVAVAYFGLGYSVFFKNFSPYIQERRQNFPEFARTGERILNLYPSAD